jgi:hypothetical protein
MTLPPTPPPPPSTVPAGWYDDASDPQILRYWDGSAWSDHTAPKNAAPPAAHGMSTKKKLAIAGGVVAGLIVLSGVAAAANGGNRPSAPAVAATQAPVETPTASATPTEAPEPVVTAVDVAAFQVSANGNLADYEKDLNDMVVTVNENGFWRLLSNSVELSFNLGQLQATDAPPSVEPQWASGLAMLDTTITGITDAIATDDGSQILAAIEASRAQVNVLRAIVASAT